MTCCPVSDLRSSRRTHIRYGSESSDSATPSRRVYFYRFILFFSFEDDIVQTNNVVSDNGVFETVQTYLCYGRKTPITVFNRGHPIHFHVNDTIVRVRPRIPANGRTGCPDIGSSEFGNARVGWSAVHGTTQ